MYRVVNKNQEKNKPVSENMNGSKGSNERPNTSPKSPKSVWNVHDDILSAIKITANKFAVLQEETIAESDEGSKIEWMRSIDKFVDTKQDPPLNVTIKWSEEMIKYYKTQRNKAYGSSDIGKMNEEELELDENDVFIDKFASAKFMSENEVRGSRSGLFFLESHMKKDRIEKVCNKIYGNWHWQNNISLSRKGCRVIVGWNQEIVQCHLMQSSRQTMCYMVEVLKSNIKFLCTFIYAANHGRDRKELWKDLILEFTWTKSLKNPNAKVLKKLDRVMGNNSFINNHNNAYANFLPYGISDHIPTILICPGVVRKINKSFRLANYITEKEEFEGIVKEEWKYNCNGYAMYQLVKKLKNLKPHLNKLNWKNGNLFQKVEELKEKLSDIQERIDKEPLNRSLREEEVKTLKEYINATQDEEKLYFKRQNKIHTVMGVDGSIHEKDKVGIQFVNHFESFIGTKSDAENMEVKDEVLFNKIDAYDAECMTKEITDDEIKRALFDIKDDKARGPDGYTSKFFKKAWVTIKKDFCNAIKEFFRTGKLLGEVNATLITLVPKVQTPINVTDFRPIACCNVVYKCISKILTNRIKPVLNKLVDQNQSAFLPGRAIIDNILLTQELLRGYNNNNGPKRCSLKIDMQKAYDTMKLLRKRTSSTILDAKKLKITHLCFEDDLLMLCHGDSTSITTIKRALEKFSKISGLHPNMSKSTMFCGSLSDEEKNLFLSILPFKMGKLPVRYLGVPLMDKKIGVNDCKSLVDKVRQKLSDWKNKSLSYAGRKIETLFKGFLWCNGDLTRGKARVAWKEVCMPKDRGGLGLKPLDLWNKTLLIKHLWNSVASKESLWVKWINTVKLKGKSIWDTQCYANDSWCWKTILSLRTLVINHIRYKIGNGRSISVWYDRWNENNALSNNIPKRDVCLAGFNDQNKICDMIEGNRWKWPEDWLAKYSCLLNIPTPTLVEEPDKTLWVTNQGKMVKFRRSSSPRTRFLNVDSVWKIVKDKARINSKSTRWADIVEDMTANKSQNSIWCIIGKLCLAATVMYGRRGTADYLVIQRIVAEIQAEHRKTVGNDGDVWKKEGRKRSKYYIVAEKQCGDDKGFGEEGVVKKISQKCKKAVVGEETGGVKKSGDDGLVDHNKKCKKTMVGEEKQVHKKNGKKDVGCKAPDVDRVHVRVSLWSLHRLIPNLSPQQRKDIIEMGFGCVLDFNIKDVPTRLSYWLLDNFNEETCVLNGKAIPVTKETIKDVLGVPMGSVYVQARDEADCRHRLVIEWKSQFGKKDRYYHGPLEQLMYTQTDGGFWFKINFLVLYFTSIGEANKNATCNLRFLHCMNDETAIHKFDWCTFILECLVRTKKSWIRRSHYTGPVIILLILYASSLRTKTVSERIGVPLVNNWTVDMLNKIEAERFSSNNWWKEVKKSVAAKLKKAGELIDEAEYELDEALEQNPNDTELIQLRDLRDVLFGSRTYSQPAKDSPKTNKDQINEQVFTPENDANKKWDFKQTDDAFPFTQFYGTPSAYIAYSEEVELERINKEKRLRSDNVNVAKFDLSLTQLADTTPGGNADVSHLKGFQTPETVQGVRAVADVSGNPENIGNKAVAPFNVCDAKPLQSIPLKAELRRTK
ncbi:peptidase C48, SUMO/sentrin/Ubl1 [Tanacetum coccineum]